MEKHSPSPSPMIRDIATSINTNSPHPTIPPLRPSLFFTGLDILSLPRPTAANLQRTHHIITILDLSNHNRLPTPSPTPTSETRLPPVHRPSLSMLGLTYHNINVCGTQWGEAVRNRMGLLDKARAYWYFANEQWAAAGAVIDESFVRGVDPAAADILFLDACAVNIGAALARLAVAEDYPVLVTCDADDAGSLRKVLAVLLLFLGVSIEDVQADMARHWSLSAKTMAARERTAGNRAWEKFWELAPDRVARIDAHLRSKYGGVDAYLEKAGVDFAARQAIRDILLEKKTEKSVDGGSRWSTDSSTKNTTDSVSEKLVDV